jgi:MFS family permease
VAEMGSAAGWWGWAGRRGLSGRAAGTIALGGVAKFASGPGQSFFLAVFVEYLVRDAGVTRSSFAVLYALATIVSSAMTIGIGRLVDREGVGRVWLGVAAGLGSACLALSVATGPVMVLVALCLMRGFGQGSFPLVGTMLVVGRFDVRRGRALSVSAQGLTLAGVLLPLVGTSLIAALGWRAALQVIAVGLFVVILPLGLCAGGRPTARAGGLSPVRLVDALRRPGVAGLLGVLGVPPLISTAIIVYGISVLGRSGLSATAAAGVISATAAAGAVGAVIGGQLSDRFPPRMLLVILGAMLAAAVALLLPAVVLTSVAGLVVLGVANGVSYTANATVWAGAYGTDGLGRLQGTANAGQIAGAAIGPLPLAVPLALTGSYVPGLAILLALALTATAAGWRWRAPDERTTGAQGHQLRPRPCEG